MTQSISKGIGLSLIQEVDNISQSSQIGGEVVLVGLAFRANEKHIDRKLRLWQNLLVSVDEEASQLLAFVVEKLTLPQDVPEDRIQCDSVVFANEAQNVAFGEGIGKGSN